MASNPIPPVYMPISFYALDNLASQQPPAEADRVETMDAEPNTPETSPRSAAHRAPPPAYVRRDPAARAFDGSALINQARSRDLGSGFVADNDLSRGRRNARSLSRADRSSAIPNLHYGARVDEHITQYHERVGQLGGYTAECKEYSARIDEYATQLNEHAAQFHEHAAQPHEHTAHYNENVARYNEQVWPRATLGRIRSKGPDGRIREPAAPAPRPTLLQRVRKIDFRRRLFEVRVFGVITTVIFFVLFLAWATRSAENEKGEQKSEAASILNWGW